MSDRKQKIIDAIPCRQSRGEMVPFAAFREHIRLLNTFSFSEKELDIIEAEIAEIKRGMEKSK